MIRLVASFAAAAVLATGGWTAFGATLPHQPALKTIAHVYAHPHRDNISVAHPAGAAPGQILF